jgi:uncharacterized glyoxalase superfamily protein PhnB
MVFNRSVPADTVLPHITYRHVAAASDWLTAVFGFTEHYRYGPPGAPGGAQMYLGNAWIMLNGERQYGARDLDGHHWLFATHARDVSPDEWGATITTQPSQSRSDGER